MESAFHMGNYVITDRQTGFQSKVFEPMSIYVRIGMHALYYGSAQEKFLRWERTIKLLEDQSIKMGEQYDDPASVKHIRPFIQSFGLEEGLKELKEPDPEKYGTFNEFFSREIREDARPIAEADNVSRLSTFTYSYSSSNLLLSRVVVVRLTFRRYDIRMITGHHNLLPRRLPPDSVPHNLPRQEILDQRLRLYHPQAPQRQLPRPRIRERLPPHRPFGTARLPPLAFPRGRGD
jgi:hypothetical protein